MKEAVFNTKWYVDEKYAELERTHIFNKLWLAAGFTSAIKSDGDYFMFRVYGQEVVVQRLHDKIVAYLNICPHRAGVVALEPSGNTRPVCKYHGWAFREGRALTGIPQGRVFETREDLFDKSCGRSLRPVAVHVVGPLIFINLDPDPLPFEAQFSADVIGWYERMGAVSSMIQLEFKADFNWKLNAENVRDYLHLFYVHTGSFAKLLPTIDGIGKTDRIVRVQETEHIAYDRYLADISDVRNVSWAANTPQDEGSYWYDDNLKRTMPVDGFLNVLCFPNTNLYSVCGRYYALQQYLPTGPDSFDYRLSIALPEMARKFDARSLLLSIARSERFVIDEDSVILRKVQANMAAMAEQDFRFSQSDRETEVMDFMTYLAQNVYQETPFQ